MHQVCFAEVAIESLLAQQQLKALVVFHQPSVRYSSLEKSLLELVFPTPTLVLELDKFDMGPGKLELQ